MKRQGLLSFFTSLFFWGLLLSIKVIANPVFAQECILGQVTHSSEKIVSSNLTPTNIVRIASSLVKKGLRNQCDTFCSLWYTPALGIRKEENDTTNS